MRFCSGRKVVNMPTVKLRVDHVGVVVPDLAAAVIWLTRAGGLSLLVREPATDADGVVFGLPGERVRLRGALLGTGPDASAIEVHERVALNGSRMDDRQLPGFGLGHIALRTDNIRTQSENLREHGVAWTRGEPSRKESGPYRGRLGMWGWCPALHCMIELLQDPG